MKATYGAEMPFLEFSTIFIVDVDDFFVDALDVRAVEDLEEPTGDSMKSGYTSGSSQGFSPE